MSITLNIVVAIAFLMGISFTRVALDGLGLKEKAFEHLPSHSVGETSKHENKEGTDYLLSSPFLFDKNS
jgi:hypothetical protein